MDLHSISKIVCRKRLVENVHQIQQKAQKENTKIIKLSLHQDSTLWEQKENLATAKAAQERQQQNMLQLQMEYENLSSKYQEELNKRPEIMNNLNYTIKICDELEKSALKCTAQSDRAKADLNSLMKVYAAADATVCSLKQQYVTIMEQAKSRIKEKLDELIEKSEQLEKLNHKWHHSQAQLHMLQSQLEAARSNNNELSATAEDTKNKLEAATKELYKSEATISSLQREMRNMAANIHSQLAEAKNILVKKDNDLKSAADEIESLKKALSNQEEFTKVQCDRNNELLEKLALVEEQHQRAEASSDEYKKKLEEMTSICENLKSNLVMIKNENEALIRDLDAKQQLLNVYTEELESYRQRVSDDGFKIDQITLELNKSNEESKNKNIIIEKLETEIRTLSETLSETQNGFQNYREETEEKLKSLAETIEAKCNEIEVHSSAAMQAIKLFTSEKEINAKLVVELQTKTASLEERDRELEVNTSALIEEKEARAKIESDLVDQKREFENEVDTLREQQKKKVFQLEAGMKAKEEEHSRKLADLLKEKTEVEREKNALQDDINVLEQRINSIMEVASKSQRPSFQPPPNEDAVRDWVRSTYREANRGQNIETEEDAVTLHDINVHDAASNFFSAPSCDSLCLRPLPRPAAEKRYLSWASSEMRSSREASPTPAAIQRVRDAPFTAADQLTSSVEEIRKLTKTSKQARPDTPLMGRAAGRNDAAAALRSQPTEKRYLARASEMRSSREASPTPAAAIQRVRDALFTALQAQSQADEPASSAGTRAALPPPAKRARPGTPVRPAVRQNGTAASNAATAGTKTTTKERRFFKSKGSKKSK